MDPRTIGLVGGVLGTIVGIAGGLYGTMVGISRARGPRERGFLIRASLAMWVGITAFLVGLWLIPMPYRFLLWVPYGILLPLAIRYANGRQDQVRRDEACHA